MLGGWIGHSMEYKLVPLGTFVSLNFGGYSGLAAGTSFLRHPANEKPRICGAMWAIANDSSLFALAESTKATF